MDRNGKTTKRLPQTIVTALLSGRHARVGGRTPRERGCNLTLIAASYARDEILCERGIGPASADRIEQWLSAQGLAFRRPADQVSDLSQHIENIP
ncbi:hypothetical protein [Ancylobacter sp. IITR112]|uniref:hypothetical protein n=1 Tax=Ancylobacter sp. IITR112 TaxID=3138073 RepID=UPI003529F0CD